MTVITNNIKWIMLISGLITCSMFYAVINPEAALNSTFGESISGPVANIVVRSWGSLITLVGAMLIYASFVPKYQKFVAAFAGFSKFIWVSLLLLVGRQFLSTTAVVIGVDLIVAILLFIFLFTKWKEDQ